MAYYNDLADKLEAGSGVIISDNVSTGKVVITSTGTGGGAVIDGVPNRITITGTSTLAIDISATYVGQTSINTLGLITSGTWSATPISVSSGGTGGISAVPYALVTGGGTTTSQLQYIPQGTANQILRCGGTGVSPFWGNESAQATTSLSALTDCETTGVTNRQLLVYSTFPLLPKWVPFTLTGATFDDENKTITITSSGSSVASYLQTSATTPVSISTSAAPAANQALVATSNTNASWQTVSHLNLSSVGTNTHAQIDAFISNSNSRLGYNYYGYNFIQSASFSEFLSRNYYCNSFFYNYVFNFSYIPADMQVYHINLPSTGLSNGQQFQLQFNGVSTGKLSQIKSDQLYIYTGPQQGAVGGTAVGGGVIIGDSTYIATYYTAGNNPWRFFADNNPSWMLTVSNYGNLININSSFTFIKTVNYAMPINLVISSPNNGQEFILKDNGGYINVNTVVLGSYNNNVYSMTPGPTTATATLNSTSATSFKFIYTGWGSNGTFSLF
jgi:hypothetical protein